MIGSLKRKQVCSTLRALAAGLVMLVVTLAPLHTHAGASDAPGVCLLCQVSHRALDLPAVRQDGVLQPAPVASERVVRAPGFLARTEVPSGRPCIPRAPPLHS